jgi:molybdopterin-containing oxidoreductase family iron-sulfur binding subunit
VIESTPTITGANADHRWVVKPTQVRQVAQLLISGLGGALDTVGNPAPPIDPAVISRICNDLNAHKSSSIVIAGRSAAEIQAIAHAMNQALGNVGKTVFYSDPLEVNPPNDFRTQTESLRELVTDIDAGKVETLIIIGGNPAYDTPIDLRLDLNRLSKVKLRAHLSLYNNETSDICQWHIPAAHFLESWSDTRAYDGTVSIVQPLIAPLYDGKTAHEMLALFSDNYDRKPYDIVKEYWRTNATNAQDATLAAKIRELEDRRDALLQRYDSNWPEVKQIVAELDALKKQAVEPKSIATDFESTWRKWLHDGFIPNTASQTKTMAPKSDWASSLQNAGGTPALPANTLEVVFRPDPSIYDGQFANNGWLQELPKPLTKITWDNVALVSPNTARKLGYSSPNFEEAKVGRKGYVDMATLGLGDQSIAKSVPVWILPGQPDDVITIHLGYGRPLGGRVGSSLGFNAYDIRRSDAPWSAPGAWINKNGQRYAIATTQLQFDMLGRDILRETPVDDYLKSRDELQGKREEQHKETHELSLYEDFDYKNQGNGYAWGMSIDLNSCVGCNACMIACQAENNIPIVGKEQVTRGRSMHWIRVDAYFKGEEAKPEGPYFQPVPCMHCEKRAVRNRSVRCTRPRTARKA